MVVAARPRSSFEIAICHSSFRKSSARVCLRPNQSACGIAFGHWKSVAKCSRLELPASIRRNERLRIAQINPAVFQLARLGSDDPL